MFNFRLILILIICCLTTSAIAGTILLMQIGLGAPGGSGPPPTCTNKLDFSKSCNSQYIPVAL